MFDFEKKKGTLIPIEEWKIIPPAIPLRMCVCVCVCVSMLAGRSYIGDSLFAFFPTLVYLFQYFYIRVVYLSNTYFRFHFKLFRTSFARSQ